MLIILNTAPGATPCKAVLYKQAVAQIASGYLVRISGIAIGIRLGGGGLNNLVAVFLAIPYVRIIERIDIDGQSASML